MGEKKYVTCDNKRCAYVSALWKAPCSSMPFKELLFVGKRLEDRGIEEISIGSEI